MQITERKIELAKLEVLDCGKPLEEALGDMVGLEDLYYGNNFYFMATRYAITFSSADCSNITYVIVQDDVVGCFDYYADLAEALDAKRNTPVSIPMDTFKIYVCKESIGVVGLITPW